MFLYQFLQLHQSIDTETKDECVDGEAQRCRAARGIRESPHNSRQKTVRTPVGEGSREKYKKNNRLESRGDLDGEGWHSTRVSKIDRKLVTLSSTPNVSE